MTKTAIASTTHFTQDTATKEDAGDTTRPKPATEQKFALLDYTATLTVENAPSKEEKENPASMDGTAKTI